MLRITSPQIATRSESRKKITSPRACPGAWTTRKPATSSPSLQHPVDLVGRALPRAARSRLTRSAWGCRRDRSPSLHRVDVVGVAGERDAARLADVLGAALVVGMDVGQRHIEISRPSSSAEDPPPVPAPAGVDQDVLGEVDVDHRPRGSPSAARPRARGTSMRDPERPRAARRCARRAPRAGDLAARLRSAPGDRRAAARSGGGCGCGPAGRSAEWTAPARARMSSTVISLAPPSSWRVLGLAHFPPPILASSASSFTSACCSTLDRVLVADHPDVVVEGAGGVGRVSGLDVEEVAAEFLRQRPGFVGQQ